MKYISEHRTGLIGTLVTHGVILIFLLYFGILITKPATPPFEEGILVNFGDSETGLGLEEPAPGEREPSVKPIESASEKIVLPSPPAKKVSAADDDPIVTQDVEKTVAVKTPKKKVVEKVIDPEKQRLAEEERLQKAEQLRQQREEQQRLAQAAAEQRKIGEINSRAKNVFGGGGKGSPDSKSTSQGITYGTGNQGVPQGSANAERYGPGGGIGNGVSFSLDGRTSQSLPKPRYPGNEEGVVVVQVTVNKSGQVTKAEAGVRGSNTADPELISAAKKAALQAKFNVDNNAPAYQTGTITYRFVLD
ncbi:TonB family protein [Aquipluma nitroreducens]|uniref:TonB family protein n=1 Tax=Aquipluma nitroreducens TaxID=2010828 RepID=UPI00296EAF64|nr:TonB family protein [Aquipluma nitroreducens]